MKRLSGLAAARPAAAANHRVVYFSTDTNTIEESIGTAWVARRKMTPSDYPALKQVANVAALPAAPGAMIGAVYQTLDDMAIYEAFPTAWADVTLLVDGFGTGIDDEVLKSATFADEDATVPDGATRVMQVGTMSAPRTLTLAPANTYKAGSLIVFSDPSGSVDGTNTVTIARSGSDTIDGATNSLVMDTARQEIALQSDGVSNFDRVQF